MSLLPKEKLPYPTYEAMYEYILERVQECMATDIDVIGDKMTPALLNRINTIARNAYKNLRITYFTYDEMVEILGTEEPIAQFKDEPMLFTLLKPVITVNKETDTIEIEMSIDPQRVPG